MADTLKKLLAERDRTFKALRVKAEAGEELTRGSPVWKAWSDAQRAYDAALHADYLAKVKKHN